MRACRLDQVCEIAMGQAPSGDAYNDEGEGWPLIAGAGDFGDLYPKPKKFTREASRVSKAGDIVLGIRASIGEKVLADGEYCLGRGVAGFRAGKELESRYLWHWLTQIQPELASKARGATFLQVNKNDIAELEISLPTLPEQRRIAAILDQADALRAKRREALAQLDSLTQSFFIEMLGDPSLSNQDFPSSSLVTLLASPLQNGAYYPKESYSNDGVEMVHMSDAFNGTVKRGGLKRVDCGDRDVGKYGLSDSDILIARRSLTYEGAAMPCRVPASAESLIFESSFIRVSPDPAKVSTEYLFRYLQNERVRDKHVRPFVTQSTISGINQSNLERVSIVVPPLVLQQTFATRIQSVESLKTTHRAALAELDALFASLQHRAFAGTL